MYAFGGTEAIGVTVGEAANPRIVMPEAIKMTFFRIAFFYIISVFPLGMLVPYNSKELSFAVKSSTSAAALPLVVAIAIAQIGWLEHVRQWMFAGLCVFCLRLGCHFQCQCSIGR